MELHELIPSDRIEVLDRKFANKEALLKYLLERCCKKAGLEEVQEEIWEALLEREGSMSTGIGLGVAIPHCSVPQVDDCVATLAVLKEGVDFVSVDDEPVRIVILLLMPKDRFERHIKTLASIARMFNNADFRQKVLHAPTPADVHALLVAGDK